MKKWMKHLLSSCLLFLMVVLLSVPGVASVSGTNSKNPASGKSGLETIVGLDSASSSSVVIAEDSTEKQTITIDVSSNVGKKKKSNKNKSNTVNQNGGQANGSQSGGGNSNGGQQNGSQSGGGNSNGGQQNGSQSGGGQQNGSQSGGGQQNGSQSGGGQQNGSQSNGGQQNGGQQNGSQSGGGLQNGGQANGNQSGICLWNNTQSSESDVTDEITVTEDGEYTTKEEVALYIHTYNKLPSNYITKKEAERLGWISSKGNLDEVAPGKSIGGSRFGNYEGILPEAKGRFYTECDIDFDGTYRGSKRIVFSNDGLIFYTEDHYKTFEQLY